MAAPGRVVTHPPPPSPIDALVALEGSRALAGTSQGLFLFDGAYYRPVAAYPYASVTHLAVAPDGLV
jgi:hypothetical protein